jgi:hypothetical protein
MSERKDYWLRPANNPSERIERQKLLDRVIRLRRDIELEFSTAAHWNEHVRKPDEAPIDPDPGGRLRQVCDDIDSLLKKEAQ